MNHTHTIYRLILLFVSVCCGAPAAFASDRPNVVILYYDDLGFGDLGANGQTGLEIPADSKYLNPTQKTLTPNLDRLAGEGLRFTAAHSADGVCTPSRYALMTGRYAWRTSLKAGVKGGYSAPLMDKSRYTIGKMFQSLGYKTAMIGKWHIGMQFYSPEGHPVDLGNDGEVLAKSKIDFSKPLTDTPRHRGFDYYFGTSASLDMPPYAWIESRDGAVRVLSKGGVVADDRVDFSQAVPATNESLVEDKFPQGGRSGVFDPAFKPKDYLQIQAQRIVDYIAARKQDGEPFFLYVPLPAPHTPHAVQEQFEGSAGSSYCDYVVQTDYYTGQILEALGDASDSDSVASNTILIATSDNGPEVGAYTRSREVNHDANGPYKGMKRDNWEGGTRVPFVVRWPGVVKPGTTDHPCTQVDIFATLAEAMAVELPGGAAPDAESFLPVLNGKSMPTERRPGFIEHSSNGQFASVDNAGEWKLLDGTGSGGNATSADADNSPIEDARGQVGGTPRQLYHLSQDPGERDNLLVDDPDNPNDNSDPTPAAIAKEKELLKLLNEIRGDDDTPSRLR
ncbi:MAG: arylsulfatase, partial [Planctomycetota bacterium]